MKISRILATASVFAILALNGGTAHAAASSLYVTPASATVAMGSTFTVSIVENGDNVNVVTANLSYDASKLSCNGVGGGSFAQTITASCGGGTVSISRYVTPGQPALSGPQTVGSLSFTAIANSGTANLSFLGTSQVASGGVNTLASSIGGVYTLTSGANGNTGGGSNNGNGSTNGSGSTSGTNTGTTTTYGPKAVTTASTSNTSSTQSGSNSTTATNNNAQSSGVLSDNQSSKDKTTDKNSNGSGRNDTNKANENHNTKRNLLMLVGLIAVATGIVSAQRYRENQALQAQAAALAAKKAKAKKPSKKTAKKTTKKKPVTRKK